MPPTREEAIDELIGLVARTSSVEICGYVAVIWMKQGKEVVSDMGLSSPLRQTFYLLGLAMTTPEPEAEEPLPKESWDRVMDLLNAITDSYTHDNLKAVTVDGVDGRKAHVAGVAFIQRFMSGRLAVAEQMERLIGELQTPFDSHVGAALGIPTSEVLEVASWMQEVLIEQAERIVDLCGKAKAIQKSTVEMLFSGPEPYEDKLSAWQKSEDHEKAGEVIQAYFFGTRYFNCIPVSRFIERFGPERATAFLGVFALRRGSVAGFRYFASPNPPNPAELAPLFIFADHDGNELVSVPLHAMLYHSIYDRFDDALRADNSARDRYLRRRSYYLESRANALVASLFPAASVVLEKYYETARSENEHDGLILAGRSVVLLEEKSAEMRTPSRDVERCFRNLTDQFRSGTGIQHGYNQANRVVDLLEAASASVPFYDDKGKLIAEIDPTNVDEVLTICVTLESFGVLAVDLSLLLDTSAGKPYPLVVNLFDLETLVEGFREKGLAGEDFLRYLRLRRECQGRLISDDELNLAGKFIFDGTLPKVQSDTFVMVSQGSEVFDELYFAKHGAEVNLTADWVPGGVQMNPRASLQEGVPVFVGPQSPRVAVPKFGRNELCPCGSGRKYKKCCGRTA